MSASDIDRVLLDPRIRKRALACAFLSRMVQARYVPEIDRVAIVVDTLLALSSARLRAVEQALYYASGGRVGCAASPPSGGSPPPLGGKKATLFIMDDLAGPITFEAPPGSTIDDEAGPQESCLRRALLAPGRFVHRVLFPGKHRGGRR